MLTPRWHSIYQSSQQLNWDAYDQGTRNLLKKESAVADLPTIEELIAARDRGPKALAELIAKKTPCQLTEIGVLIATYGLADFLAALLERGLNPTTVNVRGETTLRAAERHGKDSAVYCLANAAAEGK